MKLLMIAAFLAFTPLPAMAGDLSVTVRDKAGRPVSDAVVMVYPASGLPAGPIRFPWPYVMGQRNIMFENLVLIVPVGATVSFPNHDKVRHHVYSFAPGNKFELKLYGQDESKTVTMKTAGVVAIGCNIHDQMTAFIRVVDTPYAIKTGANGMAQIRSLPAGAATVRIYQPYLRAPKNEVAATVQVPASGGVAMAQSIDLRAPAPMVMP